VVAVAIFSMYCDSKDLVFSVCGLMFKSGLKNRIKIIEKIENTGIKML
jgi:hypothetical protein